MKFRDLHGWNLSPKEAASVQRELSKRVLVQNRFPKIRFVAGADIAIDPRTGEGIAGVIVYSFPEFEVIETEQARKKVSFPYIPGLLSFRESPILLEAFRKLRSEPDIVFIDGQGIAHPRRFGIASHMGLLLDKPTVGCAKSLLVGETVEPGKKAGSVSPLVVGGETVGAAVRTRDNVKPIFVSPGHRIDVRTSVEMVLRCSSGFRIPRPTRDADHFVGNLARALNT
jgi:deoxyribonuclease V